MKTRDPNVVIPEESLLQVLAFLVTAARTQSEEAAEYGPMRLLMAARLICDLTKGQVSSDSGLLHLMDVILAAEPIKTPTRDRAQYLSDLDRLCEEVADALLASDQKS